MVLPVVLYGHPVLKKKATDIEANNPDLKEIIENMWETMYFAKGVGLAAPQIGLSIRLFIIDTMPYYEEKKINKGLKKIFINPEIIEETGKLWNFEEGCLSIPNIHADVERTTHVKINYFDENFVEHTEIFDEMNARVIQHEYDHIEGILFIEKINPLRRQLLQRKLEKLKKGIHSAKYPVRPM
ncbi:MAG: peptide deformylase [Saprospiraceae bacterium]|nr:peptide deformylase [Saprospiraceae bacterium]